MTEVRPILRGRSHVLYRYGPGKVFRHEHSGLIERVIAIRQDPGTPDIRINREQLKSLLRSQIMSYPLADLEERQVDHTEIHVVQPDRVESSPYPTCFYCQQCGHLYPPPSEVRGISRLTPIQFLERHVPPDRLCTCVSTGGHCGGPLVQYDVLTTHYCGDEIFAPSGPNIRCPRHGATHIHWYRQGSERAARWRLACMVDGCDTSWQARDAFFRRHFGCPLDGIVEWTDTYRSDYGTFPFMKATHYMAKVVNLLNSDDSLDQVVAGTRQAAIAAAGCLRDGGAFRNFDPYSGFDHWSQGFSADAEERGSGGLTVAELLEQRQYLAEHLPEDAQRRRILENIDRQIAESQRPTGAAVSYRDLIEATRRPDYARQIRDTALYMDATRGIGLQDLAGQVGEDRDHAEDLARASHIVRELHFADVRHQERIPFTSALIGFTRGSYEPSEAKLNLFIRPDRSRGIDVYVARSTTEGIWIQLDPTATLGWLNLGVAEQVAPTGSFAGDLACLQRAYVAGARGLFGAFDDSWTQRHFGLLHTISHLLIKGAGRVTGLEQEGISEDILPYTNSLLIYANHSGDFTLGGLQLLFEFHLATVLRGLREDALRCVYNPVCEERNGSCHGCVQLAETSCSSFNRTLNRRLLVRDGGFWT